MKQAPSHLAGLIEPIVEGLGYECVGIEYNPHPKHGILRVYIDGENGIVLDDCSRVSHQLSGALDVEDPIPGKYQLEVSSPGADRPFFKIEQFERFLGHTITVTLFTPVNQRRKITGAIKGVDGDTIVLEDTDQTYAIPFQTMSKARLVPEFSLNQGVRSGK